jgi:intracellular multiplication protein IcmO
MSGGTSVKLQGVDGIRFDDTYVNGQKINLALSKDTRPSKVKYAVFIKTIIPLAIGLFSLMFGVLFHTFSVFLYIISMISIFYWLKKRRSFALDKKFVFDSPKYLSYTKEHSLTDAFPKESESSLHEENPNIGPGLFFFGHEIFTGQEAHFADSKARTHIIIFGTTGSGKTETILAICVNFLTQGSGFILVDGKGDTLLFAKVFTLLRAYGRTDDLYLLNFMDVTARDAPKTIERITHKFNFFQDVSSTEANEIVGGLMPNDGAEMWAARATTGIESLNDALYWLKDNGYLEIDPDTYRSYFALTKFVELSMDVNIPKKYRAGLRTILESVNYKLPTPKDPNPKQLPETEVQFQYITMQYTATFNMLAQQYSHITVTQVPDISIADVVLRRRILLVLLPSLAKSEQSVRNLGRIIIAMTRNVSSKAIGSHVEGTTKLTIESKPTAAVSSYGLIFDEFGTYATAGASTLPAQVRSLNLICIFAGQDYEAFKRGNEIDAATIFANCTIKICMKLEDPLTYEKFKESAGQKYVMVQESYETKDTMFGRKFIPAEVSRSEKRDILDFTDLKGQGAGEETVIYGDKTARIKSFYPRVDLTAKARLNHMLEIRKPKFSTIHAMRTGIHDLYLIMRKRLDGDWVLADSVVTASASTFSVFSGELMRLFSSVDAKKAKSKELNFPTETEIALFCLCAYVKKVELVDYNIKKSLHESMGYDFNEKFDDESLLSQGNSDMQGFGSTTGSTDLGDSRFEDVLDEADEADEGATGGQQATKKVDEQLLLKIERIVDGKYVRLSAAEQLSFNSLEAIQMSVFDTKRDIQRLEEILLGKQGYSALDAKRLGSIAASNLVAEMGLRTNPAIVGASEKRVKSSSRSSKQVNDMVSKFLNEAK